MNPHALISLVLHYLSIYCALLSFLFLHSSTCAIDIIRYYHMCAFHLVSLYLLHKYKVVFLYDHFLKFSICIPFYIFTHRNKNHSNDNDYTTWQ